MKNKNLREELYKETEASKIVEAIGNKNQAESRILNTQASTEFGVKTEPVDPVLEPEED